MLAEGFRESAEPMERPHPLIPSPPGREGGWARLLADCGDFVWVAQQNRGIDSRTVPTNAEMEVRSGHAAGRSDRADDLTADHEIALVYRYLGKVEIHGEKLITVVDEKGLAGKVVLLGKDDCATRCGEDRGPRRRAVVHTGVWIAGLSVEDAPETETSRDGHRCQWR